MFTLLCLTRPECAAVLKPRGMFGERRVFRVIDALAAENASANAARWQWQPGGWMLVDRLTVESLSSTCRSSIRFGGPPPVWERTPVRVTFLPEDDQKLVFNIRSRVVDGVNDAEQPED